MNQMGIKDRLKFIARSYINSLLDGQEKPQRRAPEPGDDEENISGDDFEKQWAQFEEEQRRWKAQQQQQEQAPPRARPGERTIEQCYKNLECPVGADLKTVRTHFRKLMRQYHPDLHANDKRAQETATRIAQKITESYQQLETYLESKGQRA
jgi:hypothetical protein